jgi:hypothetical protein
VRGSGLHHSGAQQHQAKGVEALGADWPQDWKRK